MGHKTRLVRGVGTNDSSGRVQLYVTKGGKRRKVWTCPFYQRWWNMLRRCYDPALKELRPTYAECSVCDDWLTFSNFKAWMETQDWEGKQLDKDILVPGNKTYSPETCVFVNSKVNIFLCTRRASRGCYPLGVVGSHRPDRYSAHCNNPFTSRQETIGYFDSPEEAHEAWRQRKHELACQYADMQTDPRVAEALRTRFLAESRYDF